jgi:SAM-dependent methyltransferase
MGTSPYLLGHHLLGIEGLALLRGAGRADRVVPERRIDEIAAILARLDEPPYSLTRNVPSIDTVSGYAAWADDYDTPGNVTVTLEQEAVHRLLAELPRGATVLDAACGTGRHAVFLANLGHEVIGIDSSPAMLALAQTKVPSARFEVAHLDAIPLPESSVDAAVCALALSHSPDIRSAVAELARVVRSGGRVIVSNPHPFAMDLLDWRATVTNDAGQLVVIPEYPHSHGECIAAFTAAGLSVVACIEPVLSVEQAVDEAKLGLEEAFRAALTGIPVVIIWDLLRL